MRFHVLGTRDGGKTQVSIQCSADNLDEAKSQAHAAGITISSITVDATQIAPVHPTAKRHWPWMCKKCGNIDARTVMLLGACSRCNRIYIQKRLEADRIREDHKARCLKEIIDLINHIANLTRGNIELIEKKYVDLTQSDLKIIKTNAFGRIVEYFLNAKKADQQFLAAAQVAMGLNDADVATFLATLARNEIIWDLENGRLPVLANPGIPMQKNEVARFYFPNVTFNQERVIQREFVGGSQGVSFRIARGVTYRVGSFRGHPVVRTGMVKIDAGSIIITSNRLIFSGQQKSFSIPLAKILHVTPYTDGMSVVKDSAAASAKPFVFQYSDGDLMNAAISACLNAC